MTNKKIISILALFLVLFVAVGAASAADDIAVNDVYDGFDAGVPVLNDGVSDQNGTFADLQSIIDGKNPGDTVILDKNYVYKDGSDSGVTGITIDKALTIDGNGKILDGSDISRILTVTSSDVIVKNIKFINGCTDDCGGAIFTNYNLIVDNCTFINNKARGVTSSGSDGFGGAIAFYGKNGKLLNSKLENNTARCAGAVRFAYTGLVENCSFINNKAIEPDGISTQSVYGGALYISSSNVKVLNCDFKDNYAKTYAGAIYFIKNINNFVIDNCNFDNNTSPAGGAIYLNLVDKINVTNCVFTNNKASSGGSGIYVLGYDTQSLNFISCSFINNSESALFLKQSCDNAIVNYCIFENNSFAIEFKVNGNFNYDNNYYALAKGETFNMGLFKNAGSWTPKAPNNWAVIDIDANDVVKFVLNDGTELTESMPDYDVNVDVKYVDGTTESGVKTIADNELSFDKDLKHISVVTNSGKTLLSEDLLLKTVYISSTGDDANDGTIADPVATLEKALTLVRENGKIIFMGDDTYILNNVDVNKAVTITTNGNAILSGNNANRILNITADSVTVKDLTLMDGKAADKSWAGAIYIDGANFCADNCTFINNKAGSGYDNNNPTYGGGSLLINKEGCIIKNSRFYGAENYNPSTGGIIYVNASNAKILNSSFKDSKAVTYAGAIYSTPNSRNLEIIGCNFSEIYGNNGGAITVQTTTTIGKCSFDNCYGCFGNAILVGKGYHGDDIPQFGDFVLYDCTFTNCHSYTGDALANGAVDIQGNDLSAHIYGTNIFENCTATDKKAEGTGAGALYSSCQDVLVEGTLTIINCSADYKDNGIYAFGGAIVNYANMYMYADLTIENCSAEYGGAIYNAGTFIIYGSAEFINNEAIYNGGAIDNVGTFIISESSSVNFNGNKAIDETEGSGGAIYNEGILSIDGVISFKNNTATNGGAIYNYGALSIDGDITFEDNVAEYGGAIYSEAYVVSAADEPYLIEYARDTDGYYLKYEYFPAKFSDEEIIINNAKFINNKADYGSVIFNTGKMSLSNCDFTGNDATISGAIYNNYTYLLGDFIKVYYSWDNKTWYYWYDTSGGESEHYSYGDLTISDSKFTDNTANGNGGAICVESGTLEITDSTFEDNTATGNGGAICNGYDGYEGASNAIVSGCNFTDSTAEGYGGAIYWIANGGTISNCNFINSHASAEGGAIHLDNCDNINIIGCNFTNSIAGVGDEGFGYNGGAIYLYGSSDSIISDCKFSENTATGYGGAISVEGGSLIVSDSTFNNNIAQGGAIVDIYDSTVELDNNTFTNNYALDGVVINAIGEPGEVTLTLTNNKFIGNKVYVEPTDAEFEQVEEEVEELEEPDDNSNALLFANDEPTINSVVESGVDSVVSGNVFKDNANKAIFHNQVGATASFTGDENIVEGNGADSGVDGYVYNEGTINSNAVLDTPVVVVEKTAEGEKTTVAFKGHLETTNEGILIYQPRTTTAIVECDNQPDTDLSLTTATEVQEDFANYIGDNDKFASVSKVAIPDTFTVDEKVDNGNVLFTNSTDGSLSQLVEVINWHNENEPNTPLVLSKNFTYNAECDGALENGIVISQSIDINCNGFTIDGRDGLSKLTNLFIVNEGVAFGLSNVELIGCIGAPINAATHGNNAVVLDAVTYEGSNVFVTLGEGSNLTVNDCVAPNSFIKYVTGATIVNPLVVVIDATEQTNKVYDLTANVTVSDIPVNGLGFKFTATYADGSSEPIADVAKADANGVYYLNGTDFAGRTGEIIVGVNLANADVTTATVNRVPGIMVEENYTATIGDVVPVVVIVDGYVADGKVVLYVGSIPQGTPINLANFTLNTTDRKYYYTFNVDTASYAKGVIGLSARLFVGDEPVAIVYDDTHAIELKERLPTISNVTVTGNYSDYVNITFTITDSKAMDKVVLHLLNGTNLTAKVKNNGDTTITFENIYLPFYSNGQLTNASYYRNDSFCDIGVVTWNIAKINSTVNFNVTDITSKPGVEETVLITVLDAKGNAVKQGNITVTGTGITLVGSADGVYELVDGKATVTFKCAAVGEYSLKVVYAGGVATNNTDNYNPSEETLVVKIIKTNVTVNVTDTNPSGKVNDTITITGSVEDEFGAIPTGHVEITVNGKKFTGTINSTTGAYSIEVSANESGKWADTVKFISEDPTVWADAESVPVTVSVRKLHTYIVSEYDGEDAFIGKYGQNKVLNFTVYDENNNPVNGGKLIFWFNGVAYEFTVGTDGKVSAENESFKWLSTGLYNYVVDYVNNGKVYYDSFNFTNVNIPKIETKVVIDKNVTQSTVSGGKVTITFNVTDVKGKVNVTKGVIYYVTPDGIEHSVNVVNGVATVTINVNRTGTYYIAASYYDLDGDFLYSEADFTWDVQLTETLITVTNDAGVLKATVKVNDDLGNAVNGNVDLFVNGKLMSLNVVNGVASVNLGAYNGPVELNAVFTGADGLVSSDSVIVELAAIPENGPATEEVETGLTDVDTTEMDTEDAPEVDNETTPEVDKESAPAGGVSESSGIPMQHTAIPVLALILALLVLPLGYRRD